MDVKVNEFLNELAKTGKQLALVGVGVGAGKLLGDMLDKFTDKADVSGLNGEIADKLKKAIKPVVLLSVPVVTTFAIKGKSGEMYSIARSVSAGVGIKGVDFAVQAITGKGMLNGGSTALGEAPVEEITLEELPLGTLSQKFNDPDIQVVELTADSIV